MAIAARPCSTDELLAACRGIMHSFGAEADQAMLERFAPLLPVKRVHASAPKPWCPEIF